MTENYIKVSQAEQLIKDWSCGGTVSEPTVKLIRHLNELPTHNPIKEILEMIDEMIQKEEVNHNLWYIGYSEALEELKEKILKLNQ